MVRAYVRDKKGRFDDTPDNIDGSRQQPHDKVFEKLNAIKPTGMVNSHALDQLKNDPDLNSLVSSGKSWSRSNLDTKAKIIGADGNCHWNAGKMFQKGLIDNVVLGYAQSDLGWYQHTFGIKNGKIVDSTAIGKRLNKNYFGTVMSTDKSRMFAEYVSLPENASGNGNVRTLKGKFRV
jgi:hypothetical protein